MTNQQIVQELFVIKKDLKYSIRDKSFRKSVELNSILMNFEKKHSINFINEKKVLIKGVLEGYIIGNELLLKKDF